jgi:hypothetical protein
MKKFNKFRCLILILQSFRSILSPEKATDALNSLKSRVSNSNKKSSPSPQKSNDLNKIEDFKAVLREFGLSTPKIDGIVAEVDSSQDLESMIKDALSMV